MSQSVQQDCVEQLKTVLDSTTTDAQVIQPSDATEIHVLMGDDDTRTDLVDVVHELEENGFIVVGCAGDNPIRVDPILSTPR